MEKRLPKFLTVQQMVDLINAPLKPLSASSKKTAGRPVVASACYRDVAILETIYSCGMRISELCGLCAADLDINEQIVRVRGKGKKERLRSRNIGVCCRMHRRAMRRFLRATAPVPVRFRPASSNNA